jgi:predicted transcriptional regulator
MERDKIGAVLLPEHKEALKHLASDNGESMSALLRRLIREEAQRRGVWQAGSDRHKSAAQHA